MVKTPEFDERPYFGASSVGHPIAAPETIKITEGAVVDLAYKKKMATIRVTRIIKPQEEFEGMIEAFDRYELEHAGLKQGDEVRFPYSKIAHIHSQGRR